MYRLPSGPIVIPAGLFRPPKPAGTNRSTNVPRASVNRSTSSVPPLVTSMLRPRKTKPSGPDRPPLPMRVVLPNSANCRPVVPLKTSTWREIDPDT